MTTQLPWAFEPCENEGPICDPSGTPWSHAVRGRKPQRPAVIGYGHHPDDAERDATHKAHQQDAREVLGERGEVITQLKMVTRVVNGKSMITVYDAETDTALVQGQLIAVDFYAPPFPSCMSSSGSLASWTSWGWSWPELDIMPIGT